jgi:hypothetical protein
MVESSERSRKKVFRREHVQNEAPTVPQAPRQGQIGHKNSGSSAKGSPGDDSADRGSSTGERHSQPVHKRTSMSSHSVSARNGLQAFDERTSSVGLTQQVCELHVPHLYARVLIGIDIGLDHRRFQPRDHTGKLNLRVAWW